MRVAGLTSVEPVAGTVLWARKIAVVRRAGAWDRLSLAARCLRLVLPIFFFFQAEDGIRDIGVTGVQTCALPILAVLMLDGIELKGRCCVVALGIDTDGIKHPLGLWDGSTENATVATTLLANLVERGLDVEHGVLVVLDGAKALPRPSATCSGPTRRSSGAFGTRNAMSSGICPSTPTTPSGAVSEQPGRSTITTARSS